MEKQLDTLLYEKINHELCDIQEKHESNSNGTLYRELEINGIGKSMLPRSRKPFLGHMNRFGHYYRHLFQTVKFVVNQNEKFLDNGKKIEYLRTLRAQLSDHEQVMLYLTQ